MDESGWIDISVMLCEPMPTWPHSVPFHCEQASSMADGSPANTSTLTMGSHAGTHIDAPRHFVRDGRTIDTIPLDATVGMARVIEITDKEAIKPEELAKYNIQNGERILFKTENSNNCWQCDEFLEEYIGITKEAAQMLVDCGVRSVGVDYLAVGGYHADILETHQILLGAGIWLIEGLDLINVAPGMHELICLPLKILGCDSSPARAIVRPVDK